MRYRFIDAYRDRWRITTMCRVLRVSKAGYYEWARRGPSARAYADAVLIEQVRAVHAASRQRYGSPRVHRELRAQGERISRKRVARAMRLGGVRGKRPRRYQVTTQSQHAYPVAANVLDRQFAVATVPATNRVWSTDITYIPTHAGWLYLAVVLDLASRRVVGWAMQPTLDRTLALCALQMALVQRQPSPGLVHHSDRGAQYASMDYRAQLAAHGITCSMSRKGNCWDNAVAESFFATLKVELVHDAQWHTHAEAKSALFEYIEVWYNRQRRHSSLDYQTPVEYEQRQQENRS
jgi:transposase InsO family protein